MASVPLYLLLSGDVLYVGLALSLVGTATAEWRRHVGGVVMWCGLILALVSAVPLHPAAYALLVLCGFATQAVRRRTPRTRRVAFALFAAVVLAIGGPALADRSQGSLRLPDARPLFVIGDSLSAGLGPSDQGTWPHLLAGELGIRVTNLAKAGSTLTGGISQAGLLPRTQMVVLIELGGNDLLGGAPRARFAADLRALLSAVVHGDRRVLMFELPLLPFQNGYGHIQRALCAEYGVTLVPRHVLAGTLANPDHTIDGLHLSAEGQASLARRIAVSWRIEPRSVPKRK